MWSHTVNSTGTSQLSSLRICGIACFILATYGIINVLSAVPSPPQITVHNDIQRALISKEETNDTPLADIDTHFTSITSTNLTDTVHWHYTKKSKYVAECPADFLQLVERDRIFHSGVYTPTKYTNYASLKHTFWNEVIPRQESQLNAPDTLQTIQIDELLTEISDKSPFGNVNGLQQHGCAYNGRVFGVGMYKTGTSSLRLALGDLGYIDNGITSLYRRLHPYYCGYSHWYLTLRHYYDYMNSVSNINNNQLLDQLLQKSQRSFLFADSPMFYFWPFLDRWYPGSKFILTVRGSPAKFVNSLMKFCLQLQECMNWIFYPDLDTEKDGMRHRHKRYRRWKNGKKIRTTLIGLSKEELAVYNWSSVGLTDYRWNKADEVDGEQLAHYIAMIYELHNQRIIEHFRKHGQMDRLLVLNADEMDDEQKWTAVTKFLECSNEPVLRSKTYPHANPTKSLYKSINLVPNEFELDWKRYFNGTIPMMMTTHTPVRKIWFEYQTTEDYEVLI